MRLDRRGFTLIEIVVVMALFLVVIAITGQAFQTILQQTAKLFRSEESTTEGVVGLEMVRHDIQQAGYGLFTQTSPVDYDEAQSAPASTYNEPSDTAPPRAVVAGNNLPASPGYLVSGSDYLVIKGTTVGSSPVAQKWTHLVYAPGSGTAPYTWASKVENFTGGDKVVLLSRSITSGGTTASIVPQGSSFYFSYGQTAFAAYSTNTSSYFVYGLDDANARMPFNRVDYFVGTGGTMPQLCAQGTGTLYKGNVNQSNGALTKTPILDCVADMQVVFGWDLADAGGNLVGDPTQPGDGEVDTWSNADGTITTGSVNLSSAPTNPYVQQTILADPGHVRTKLKVVKVYILAQVGRR
ncbi:MAG TPA: type II secretion system protein, partial [Desulfuromonadaceae bacterium]